MKKTKTQDNVYIKKYNNENIPQNEDLNTTFNENEDISTRNILSYKINSLNQYKNKINRKYKTKLLQNKTSIQNKKKLKQNEKKKKINLKKDKEKDNKKKIHIVLNGQNYNTKKLNTLNNNNLIKKNTKISVLRKKNKNNNNDNDNDNIYNNNGDNNKEEKLKKINLNKDLYINNSSLSRQNLNENKNYEVSCNIDYNGGDYLSKKFGEKEKNIIFSKINIIKKNNYFNNYNKKTINTSKVYNKGKNLNEKSKRQLSIDNIEDSQLINTKKNNHKINNMSQDINSIEYTENGGITSFNKSYDVIKKFKNTIPINNKKFSIVNKNKLSKLTKHNKHNKEVKIKKEDKYTQKKSKPKINVIKNNTYKKLNLSLNQKYLVNSLQSENKYFLTTNASRNNISYRKNLEQKKKLLRINLNFKDYKIIKKRMEEDLSSKDIKKCIYNLHKNLKIEDDEEQTIKIIDHTDNKIKMIRKRFGNNIRNKRNIKNKYENELGKKTEDNTNSSLNIEKTEYINKKIDLNIIPKGLELIRRLTEM